MIERIKRKIGEYKEKYAIWRERPTSTFQEISDIWAKQPILDKAYHDALHMLQRDRYMFNEACTALLSGNIIRKAKHKERNIVDIIASEDQRINEYARKIRTNIMEYLAANSAPDVPSSLILTSLVIDLERLGDYTKGLAKLTLIHPVKLDKKYYDDIKEMRNFLMDMFRLAVEAFEHKDKDKAGLVMDMYKELKTLSIKVLLKLEKDKKIRGKHAVVYALYTRYFRRVAGHLQNVASSVIAPFPYLGFKRSVELIEKSKGKEEDKSKEKGKKKGKAKEVLVDIED